MGGFRRLSKLSIEEQSFNDVKDYVLRELEKTGIFGTGEEEFTASLTTDVREYIKNPTGTLTLSRFWNREVAKARGMFVPLYGYPQDEIEVPDPFEPDWWTGLAEYKEYLMGIETSVRVKVHITDTRIQKKWFTEIRKGKVAPEVQRELDALIEKVNKKYYQKI